MAQREFGRQLLTSAVALTNRRPEELPSELTMNVNNKHKGLVGIKIVALPA